MCSWLLLSLLVNIASIHANSVSFPKCLFFPSLLHTWNSFAVKLQQQQIIASYNLREFSELILKNWVSLWLNCNLHGPILFLLGLFLLLFLFHHVWQMWCDWASETVCEHKVTWKLIGVLVSIFLFVLFFPIPASVILDHILCDNILKVQFNTNCF